jgi:hypothetical protein
MTELMEKALVEINKLTETEQNALAALILEEIESERLWTQLFAESEDLLSQLADEALAEHRAGKTKPLNLDEL